MKDAEIDEFEKRFGYKPVGSEDLHRHARRLRAQGQPGRGERVCRCRRSTPSSPRRARAATPPTSRLVGGSSASTGSWSLGSDQHAYGRNSASGTYGFFKDNALFKGDYKDSVKEQPGSSSVVQGVASDRNGIGYSGIGYKTADVDTVPLATQDRAVRCDRPPLRRRRRRLPARALPPGLRQQEARRGRSTPCASEFLKLIFSKEGQEIVVKDGYLPVSSRDRPVDSRRSVASSSDRRPAK